MSMHQYFRIDVYSHNFSLSRILAQGRSIIEQFARQYVQYGLVKEGRRFVRAPVKVFASRLADGTEYRFHIEQYGEFLKHLTNVQLPTHAYETVMHPLPESEAIVISTLEKWVMREMQKPAVEYIISDEPNRAKLLELQTGTGKTLMAVKSLTEIKKRFAIIIKPMYIEKWVSDLNEICGIDAKEVIVVQGSAQLMAIIAQGKANELEARAIIFSNKTLQNWYSLYEKVGHEIVELGYDCYPHELFETLRVGVRVIDEVHQDFHLNFKVDLYTNVPKSISLSATLKSDDPFLNRMYEVAYPKPMRFAGFAYNRYINAYSWLYRVNNPNVIRTTEYGSTTYSHHAFEKSVIRNPRLLDDYMNMIVAAANRFFFERYVKGDRMLVYCASIQMCTLVVEHLKNTINGMDVRRYVEEDPYDNLMVADVSVSTLLSAGTGVDIPGLTTVILTTAINSSQSNIQGFGRLRQLKDKKLQFAYFVGADIPKHVEYHTKKMDLLNGRALTFDVVNYHHLLG